MYYENNENDALKSIDESVIALYDQLHGLLQIHLGFSPALCEHLAKYI